MRLHRIVATIALSACLGPLGGAEEKKADYEVHEWGVFTVPRDAKWLQQDMLSEWQSFPEFFHGVLPGRQLSYRGPVRKPVLFFHGESKDPINLTLKFKEGRPLIWWPPAEFPAGGIVDLAKDTSGMLNYRIRLGDDSVKLKEVPKGHWVADLRRVKSTSIGGNGGWGSRGGRRGPGGGENWSESFIYYDGLMKSPAAPVLKRSKRGVLLRTESDHDWQDVLIVDRSLDGKSLAIGYAPKVGSGKQATEIELTLGKADAVRGLAKRLVGQLVAAGLHEDEAQSLLDLWSEALFEQSGLTLIYRIPQSTYDDWISLKCEPAPRKTVRVGLVVHQHLEPELEETVNRLVDELSSEGVKARNKAEMELRRICGAAMVALEKSARGDDPERATRAREILKSFATEKDLLKLMEKFETNRGK